MAKSNKTLSSSVEDKLKALYTLQSIDSDIDKLRVVRGELPIEIQDLEDEIVRLEAKKSKVTDEINALKADSKGYKALIKQSSELVTKYKLQLDNIKNNREYISLNKEIEFQELEMELAEKKIKETKAKIAMKDEVDQSIEEMLSEQKAIFEQKESELSNIVAETEKEEKLLIKKSDKSKKSIDERLLNSYQRIRQRVRNGLAVVSVDRDACGGCFNKIPPQMQLDIKLHKKITVCEHCGRILVDSDLFTG